MNNNKAISDVSKANYKVWALLSVLKTFDSDASFHIDTDVGTNVIKASGNAEFSKTRIHLQAELVGSVNDGLQEIKLAVSASLLYPPYETITLSTTGDTWDIQAQSLDEFKTAAERCRGSSWMYRSDVRRVSEFMDAIVDTILIDQVPGERTSTSTQFVCTL